MNEYCCGAEKNSGPSETVGRVCNFQHYDEGNCLNQINITQVDYETIEIKAIYDSYSGNSNNAEKNIYRNTKHVEYRCKCKLFSCSVPVTIN